MLEFYMILVRKLAKKYPNFIIFSRKINKTPEFYMTFVRKMPEFYIIIARKIFFPNFRGARAPMPSPTPTTMDVSMYFKTCYKAARCGRTQ